MNNTTVAQTSFFYSDCNGIAVTTKSRCLYNAFTVAVHLGKALERFVSVYEIEAMEEWQHILWVKLKGCRPRFVSKKKIQQDCSSPQGFGGILINLSSRIVSSIDSDDCTFLTFIGYSDERLARKARGYILSRNLALTADVLPSEGIAAGEWVLRIRGMLLASVMYLALREVREEIEQKSLAAM